LATTATTVREAGKVRPVIDIPLNDCAASVLDDVPETDGSVTVEQLRARLATESMGRVGELSRLDGPTTPGRYRSSW